VPNLVERQPDVRDRLAAELGSYLSSVKAQMPVVKASGETVAYPGSAVRVDKDRRLGTEQ